MKPGKEKTEIKIRITHNKKLLWIILFLIIILVILIYFIMQNKKNNENQKINSQECQVDSDCTPSSCCHADSCVPLSKKPECERIFCSMVCSGPLDCGAGYCSCVNGKCQVISNG